MTVPKEDLGANEFDMMEAVFLDPALYEFAEHLPRPDPRKGGRPRKFHDYFTLGYGCLADIWKSERHAATVLASGPVYQFVRNCVAQMVPPDLQLPPEPPHRTWFLKKRASVGEAAIEDLREHWKPHGVAAAREIGLLDPEADGSPTHPALSCTVTCDGKVIDPLYRTSPTDTRTVKGVDHATGEVIEIDVPIKNFDPDVKQHHVGGREKPVSGLKFWHAETRGEFSHERVYLAVDYVPGVKDEKNSEMDIAMPHLLNLADLAPGIQVFAIDGAARSVHRSELIRKTGKTVVSPAIAKKVDPKTGDREEKEGFLSEVVFDYPDGTTESVEIWHCGGWLTQRIVDEDGHVHLEKLHRTRNNPQQNDNGEWRDYVYYDVPNPRGGPSKTISERTWENEDDVTRGFKRAELIHQIPPKDEDFRRLYPRRSESESLNRQIDDFLPLGRARSIGWRRQLFDLWCHAFVVTAYAKHRHRQRTAESDLAAAA